MRRIKFIFISIYTIGLFNIGLSQSDSDNKYLSDFNILITSLKELHPILYKNISKEDFDNDVKNISERLTHTTSQFKAIYLIQELIYKIGNGHAGDISVYNGDLGVLKVLPFSVYILGDELYINDYPADTSFNGTKINSIEKTNSKSIIDSLKIFFPTDGQRNVICYFLQPFFNTFYGAFCSQKDTFLVDTQKGLLKTAAAVKGTDLFDKLVVKKNWGEYFGQGGGLKTEVNENYGYFRFERFNNSKTEEAYYSMIKDLNNKKINNIIIDLRYNNGGEDRMTGRMASYLSSEPFKIFENIYTTTCRKPTYLKYMDDQFYFKFRKVKSIKKDSLRKVVRFEKSLKEIEPNKERFRGHIYILTSSITLSASTMFCKYLIGQPNVSFVGSETSGAVNYLWAGNFCSLKLQNLNTVFSFGVELLELKENSIKNELPVGLIPENKIEYSIQDLLAKKDNELEWIKNDIKKSAEKISK
jgi:hypothetical protein